MLPIVRRRQVEASLQKDPFLRYGLGIYLFFNVVFTFVLVLGCMSLVAFLQMKIYSSNLAEPASAANMFGWTVQSLPSPAPVCLHLSSQKNEVQASCEGSDVISRVTDLGILDAFEQSATNQREGCAIDRSSLLYSMSYKMDSKVFSKGQENQLYQKAKASIESACVGKNMCSLS